MHGANERSERVPCANDGCREGFRMCAVLECFVCRGWGFAVGFGERGFLVPPLIMGRVGFLFLVLHMVCFEFVASVLSGQCFCSIVSVYALVFLVFVRSSGFMWERAWLRFCRDAVVVDSGVVFWVGVERN